MGGSLLSKKHVCFTEHNARNAIAKRVRHAADHLQKLVTKRRRKNMETVLITGASSGIGLEFAKLFAKAGSGLILTARREEKLHKLADELHSEHGVPVSVVPADLAKPDGTKTLHYELNQRSLQVDVLVNNAGFGALGKFADLPLERQVDMLHVNILALTELTRRLLPEMIERKRGGVLNVGSTAAFQPGPNMAVYYATKAYVLSFSEALREELLDTGVHVTCLAPGPTETEFGEDSGMNDTKIFRMGTMPAATVAKAGYEAFRANDSLVVPGAMNKVASSMHRFLPRMVTRKFVKNIQPVQ